MEAKQPIKTYKVELSGNGRVAHVKVQATTRDEACAIAKSKYGIPYEYPYAFAWEDRGVTW